MLYNKRWDKIADPFTTESLIAWLEQQPADKTYNYYSRCDCMLAQYFTAKGFRDVSVTMDALEHADGTVNLPPHLNEIADGPFTFGLALERALAHTRPHRNTPTTHHQPKEN